MLALFHLWNFQENKNCIWKTVSKPQEAPCPTVPRLSLPAWLERHGATAAREPLPVRYVVTAMLLDGRRGCWRQYRSQFPTDNTCETPYTSKSFISNFQFKFAFWLKPNFKLSAMPMTSSFCTWTVILVIQKWWEMRVIEKVTSFQACFPWVVPSEQIQMRYSCFFFSSYRMKSNATNKTDTGSPVNLSYECMKLHFWLLQWEFNNTAFHTKHLGSGGIPIAAIGSVKPLEKSEA